jgi:hypothetical protein
LISVRVPGQAAQLISGLCGHTANSTIALR